MTARGRLAALVGAVLLAVTGAVPVAAHDPSPIFEGDGLWAQDADLTFDWSDTWMAPFDMRVAIKDGAADQNASRGAQRRRSAPSMARGTSSCTARRWSAYRRPRVHATQPANRLRPVVPRERPPI